MKFSKEHRKKLSESIKKSKTPELLKKHSEMMKKYWLENGHLRKYHHSEDTKRKIGKKSLGRKWSEKNKQLVREKNTGDKNGFWKGGIIKEDGYIRIRRNNKYIAEHRLLMEEKIGRTLDKNEIVHHIDGDRANNNINNLILCKSISEHRKIHASMQNLVYKLIKNNYATFNSNKKIYELKDKISQ